MSDPYNFEASPQINVNVQQPEAPAAPPPGVASEDEVNSFLAGGSASPSLTAPVPAGSQPTYRQDPRHSDFSRGVAKSLGRGALGLLSWIPGTGDLFTEKGWLGQRAYAPGQSAGEDIGIGLGSLVPGAAAGRILQGVSLTPAMMARVNQAVGTRASRAIGEIFSNQRAYPGSWANPRVAGAIPTARAALPRVQAAKGVMAGAIGGAAEATPGDSSYTAKAENAALGGAVGALTGFGIPAATASARNYLQQFAGLNPTQQNQASAVASILAGIGGVSALGFHNPLIMAAAAYMLHRSGWTASAAHAAAPAVTALAARLYTVNPMISGAAGGGAAKVASDVNAPAGLR
jgi:hypothetical protein